MQSTGHLWCRLDIPAYTGWTQQTLWSGGGNLGLERGERAASHPHGGMGRHMEPSLAISLTFPSLLRFAIRRLLLCRLIFKLTAFCLTPRRLAVVASSPCLVQSRARTGSGMVIWLSSSVRLTFVYTAAI
eukprot:GFUD01070682.1.p2 GENE.GFUD01070682.1~~GFUD01070682.1.p2  ORF type:complete len:130 (+),score=18.19 GFUD01070682.1:545-934(+)